LLLFGIAVLAGIEWQQPGQAAKEADTQRRTAVGQRNAAVLTQSQYLTQLSNQKTELATEEQIRDYAHLLWEQAGRPEGRADDFWHAAEVELKAESGSPDATTESTQPDTNTPVG
jgi:hypothetical protein